MGLGAENLPKLLNTILNSFIDLCGCDGGSIFTLHKNEAGGPVLVFEAMVTRSMRIQQVPDHLRNLRFALNEESLVGKTATQRRSFKVTVPPAGTGPQGASAQPDAASGASHADGEQVSPRVDNILQYVTRNILSAPLVTPRGDLVGVVQLLNKNSYTTEDGVERRDPEFDDRDERLFSIVAGQAALAIENSLLLEEQERLLEGFVNACVTAIESRDPVTSGHSKRVSDYTTALAEAISRSQEQPYRDIAFTETQIREIRFAAMLHDIGKISVREQVLHKEKKLLPWELEVIRMRLKLIRAELKLQAMGAPPELQHFTEERLKTIEQAWKVIADANEPTVLPAAVSSLLKDLNQFRIETSDGDQLPILTSDEGIKLSIQKGSLTTEERHEIERHVSYTYEILKLVPWSRGLEAVPEIAWRHHEKLDGTGYPCKCPAHQIPVQSRMLTICDIYDALTADDRPYKRAVPIDKALEILAQEVRSGKLDPELFKLFVDARVHELYRVKPKKDVARKAA